MRHSWLSGTRRVPVLAFAALALGATARADLATPLYVPVPVVAAVSTNITERFVAVVCSVSNTSAYARSGRVALYDILGAKLVESRYDLNPQQRSSSRIPRRTTRPGSLPMASAAG